MESDNEGDWSDAPELDEEVEVTKSLFSVFEGTPDECLADDRQKYGWSLDQLEGVGEYDFIKIVNFCRAEKFEKAPPKEEFLGKLKEKWSQDRFYKPTIPDDPFLMHQWDTREKESEETEEKRNGNDNQESNASRKREIESLMRETEIGPLRENAGYFDGYGDYGIHAEMLQDTHRTESYRDTIYKNPRLFKDKIVVDVGAGTGILSLFAAQGGAKEVFAVEMSDIAFDCMDVIRENGMGKKIKVLKGAAEDLCSKIPLCDVIVSEWMGYCLLFEGMLDTVLAVRDKLLRPSGIMVPATAHIDLCLVQHEKLWHDYLGFWDNVYGFKMNSLRTRARREARINLISAKEVASPLQRVISWDLKNCSVSDLTFRRPVRLTSSVAGFVHGVTASFDCDMIRDEAVECPIVLSTSPFAQATHWKQATFLFDEPLKVTPGQCVSGFIQIKRQLRNDRELEVKLDLACDGKTICSQKYSVS